MAQKPITEVWRERAEAWVELEAAANLYEETKSATLSQMMLTHGDIPVSKAELLVKGSSEWKGHVERIAGARKAANLARVAMDHAKMLYWDSQSRAATERLEARI